jgi:hypothetical protein
MSNFGTNIIGCYSQYIHLHLGGKQIKLLVIKESNLFTPTLLTNTRNTSAVPVTSAHRLRYNRLGYVANLNDNNESRKACCKILVKPVSVQDSEINKWIK